MANFLTDQGHTQDRPAAFGKAPADHGLFAFRSHEQPANRGSMGEYQSAEWKVQVGEDSSKSGLSSNSGRIRRSKRTDDVNDFML